MKRNVLILYSISLLALLQGCVHKTQEIQFQRVVLSELNSLVEFSVNSNDVYKTRKSSRETARKVFELEPYQVKEGLIEKIVDKDGEILGFYSLKKPCKVNKKVEIELGHINVKPSHMYKGLGTALFKRACQKARALKATRMHWISDPDAKGFYLKQGAQLIGTDENLLNPDVDVPLFEILFPS